MGDKTYKSKGKTILEALEALEIGPFIKAKGLFKVREGSRKGEKLMFVPQMKKIFLGGRIHKEIFAKQLTYFLR